MDPYLEQFWGDVHTRLTMYTADALNPQLGSSLRARVEERVVLQSDEFRHGVRPDVRVFQRPGDILGETEPTSGVALMDPISVIKPLIAEDPQTERFVRIVDVSTGGTLVTVIEVLSPANKGPANSRAAQQYDAKRKEYFDGGVSVVEIDLLRAGERPFPRRGETHEDVAALDYAACIRKAWGKGAFELYAFDLRKPLPAIRIPLRQQDKPAILNLQELIEKVYANGGYDDIDYTKPARPPLRADDEAWAAKLTRM
jgi:hypothetical protein